MSYRDYMRRLLPAPLQGTWGSGFARGAAQHLDDLATNLKAGAKRGMPAVTGAEGDDTSLGYLGTERGMPRYPAETSVQYGARLRQAWSYYARAGAAPVDDTDGMLAELAGLGFGGVTLMEYIDWDLVPASSVLHQSPDGWTDANGDPWWSRFWLFISEWDGVDIPGGAVMGTGVMGTAVMGTTLDLDLLNSTVAAICRLKPAHALAVSITWVLDGTPLSSVMGFAVMGTAVMGIGAGSGLAVQPIMK